MRLIDADVLEKDGWMMHRTVQVDKNTMSYQTKKPKDFPTVERKMGEWKEHEKYPNLAYLCSECGYFTTFRSHFCPNCGTDMSGKITKCAPPLGLMPKKFHDYKRMVDIFDAMKRYSEAETVIPIEWIDELKELIERRNDG